MIKKLVKLGAVSLLLFATVTSVNAYNGKFTFKLTSGWWSPWNYSDPAYKVTKSEAPVVTTTYVSGDTRNFAYKIVNSNLEARTAQFEYNGTFAARRFTDNSTVRTYMYHLSVRRAGSAWNTDATAQGLWNPDSF